EVERHNYQKAVDLFERIVAGFPESQRDAQLGIAYSHAKSGNIDLAKQVFNQASPKPGEDYVSAIDIAQYYSAIGEKDTAFEILNRAFENHAQELCQIRGFPESRVLASDPRFTELLKRLNLPT